MAAKFTIEEANAAFKQYFAGAGLDPDLVIAELDEGRALITFEVKPQYVRHGGMVAGPCHAMLADFASSVSIMTVTGFQAMAVTTQLNTSFLRPLKAKHIEAEATLIKAGRNHGTAIVEIRARGAAKDDISSYSVATFSLPKDD